MQNNASLYTSSELQIKVDFEKISLENGLNLLLHVDKNVPIVAVNLWYHVGSAREATGKSGFAHLFEHMMFQGSKNVPNGHHFRLIEEAGGSLNGSTSTDRTNYWEVVPKNYLETVLWLESDRMGWLLPALTQEKLDNQREVVKNERRQNYDNRPYGLAFEILSENLYPPGHPYSWTTIGSMEDLTQASLDDVKNFFKRYYVPNNASLAIGGDIEIDETLKLVKKYFDSIPSGENVPIIQNKVLILNEEKRIVHEDTVQLPRLYIAWHSSTIFGPDDAEMDMIADAFGTGKNSRLYKALVYEKQIAQDVSVYHISRELGSVFIIVATAKVGINLSQIEEALTLEIKTFIDEGPTRSELERIKNSHKSSFVYSLQRLGGFSGITDRLNEYNIFLNDPGFINGDLNRYLGVEKDTLCSVAKKYLQDRNKVVLSIVPKGKYDLQARL